MGDFDVRAQFSHFKMDRKQAMNKVFVTFPKTGVSQAIRNATFYLDWPNIGLSHLFQ